MRNVPVLPLPETQQNASVQCTSRVVRTCHSACSSHHFSRAEFREAVKEPPKVILPSKPAVLSIRGPRPVPSEPKSYVRSKSTKIIRKGSKGISRLFVPKFVPAPRQPPPVIMNYRLLRVASKRVALRERLKLQ